MSATALRLVGICHLWFCTLDSGYNLGYLRLLECAYGLGIFLHPKKDLFNAVTLRYFSMTIFNFF